MPNKLIFQINSLKLKKYFLKNFDYLNIFIHFLFIL